MSQGKADDFGNWFAGFVDGEGCFLVARRHCCYKGNRTTRYGCTFQIALRADDAPVLHEICARLGVGRVVERRAYEGERYPQASWRVQDKRGAQVLVKVFDRYPLRAKKARDYVIWREAVKEWSTVDKRARHDWSRLAELKVRLERTRRFTTA